MNEKHRFLCKCGDEFITTFAKFQNRNKHQCNTCGRKRHFDLDRLSYDDVRTKIESFGCELVSNVYLNYSQKLEIRCPCGNVYEQKLCNFIYGTHRCPKCAQKISNRLKMKYSYEYVYNLCLENNCELLTNKVNDYIKYNDPIIIKCKCGEIFKTKLFMCLSYNKFKCNSCVSKNKPQSNGEIAVESFLRDNRYNYKSQYSFTNCKNKYSLRFDFAVFQNDRIYLIEYDGVQHFKPYDYYGGKENFEKIRERDEIKNKYCAENHIPLLRINYIDYKNIEEILSNYLQHDNTVPSLTGNG